MVGRGPGGGYDDGVDDGGDGFDAGFRGGDDEGGLCGRAGLVVEAWVGAGDEHAYDEDGEDVEEGDAEEDSFAGSGNDLAGVACFCGGHRDALCACKREDGGGHTSPVSKEVAPGPRANIFDKGAGCLPVVKAQARDAWDATKVDDQSENDQEDDENNLEQSEPEFDLQKR